MRDKEIIDAQIEELRLVPKRKDETRLLRERDDDASSDLQ